MNQPTTTYATRIADAINTGNLPTIAVVESLMRDQHGTLDNLGDRFDGAARRAMADAIMLALSGDLPDYCEPLNLAVPTLRV